MAGDTEIELADSIASSVNSFSFDYEKFCDRMLREHRTLQQSFMRLILAWIRKNSELDDDQFDTRNEASVRICKELQTYLDENGIDSVPLI